MQRIEGTLYSLVLTMTPTEPVTVPATVGRQVHAAFLNTVKQADPLLADALHAQGEAVRPFTVSPLQGVPRAHNGRVRLSPERTYWLRFTILHPAIFQQFMANFLYAADRPVLRLGRAELLIREILITPEAHPWSGYTTWAALAQDAEPQKALTLEFVTPTAFGFGQRAWGKKIVVLPDPEPVFGNLMRSWNRLAPEELQMDGDSLIKYVGEHVVIKRLHGLQTKMLHYSRSPQIGFVGRVTYGLMADDEAIRRQLNALADFAFYAGVGMKTTMGMGMTRRLREPGDR